MPRWSAALFAACAIYFLFFFRLTGAGLLGPDEPRYAAVGREMALSGDWVTPRLWGEPWFEKPPLLYWMTAIGFRAGLGDDLAPRLPVALLSVGFLAFFFLELRHQFGERPAAFAAAVLSTSAGWLGFSHAAVTDLPLTAFLASAMLLSLDWVRTGDRRRLPVAAACLGAAVLAKGPLAVVLALPLVWFGRRRLLDLIRPAVALSFLAVAAPWYLLMTFRSGSPFLQVFFLQHNFGRFTSSELQHVQPFWYYLPVLAAWLFPWTPGAVLIMRRGFLVDERRWFLLAWIVWGFVFLSASVNKLPGYLLPLLPAAAALTGLALDEAKNARLALAVSALLLCLVAPLSSLLPDALAAGFTRARVPAFHWTWLVPVPVALAILWNRNRVFAITMLTAAVSVAVVYLKISAFPKLDSNVSARGAWREIAFQRDRACVEEVHRSLRYGLSYYSVVPLPACAQEDRPLRVKDR